MIVIFDFEVIKLYFSLHRYLQYKERCDCNFYLDGVIFINYM